jgi:hypothetical protein
MIFIIVEGITDKALVNNILNSINKEEDTDYKFLGLKGVKSVIETIESLEQKDIINDRYFAIVDADTSFEARKIELEKAIGDKNIDFFIFPNNRDDGDLEDLLLSNIDKENKIIKCFDEYKKCVDKKIDNKAKLYAYTTLQHNKKPEEYIETWDLNENFDTLKQKLKKLFNDTNNK